MTLSDLLGRVEGAGGPDRELDADIDVRLLGGETVWRQANGTMEMYPATKRPSEAHIVTGYRLDPVYAYTDSIDAALGLVERKLPGWVVEHIGADAVGVPMQMKTIGWTVELGFGSPLVIATEQGRAPTLPLAICAALIRALIQLET